MDSAHKVQYMNADQTEPLLKKGEHFEKLLIYVNCVTFCALAIKKCLSNQAIGSQGAGLVVRSWNSIPATRV